MSEPSHSPIDPAARHEAARGVGHLDLIVCDRCGRSFATADGPGMIAAIKGPCPDCGGRFRLASSASDS